MAQRIIIDPITRIEGHLRVEVEMAGDIVKGRLDDHHPLARD